MARLAQLVERGTFNPEVKCSSPLSGDLFFKLFFLDFYKKEHFQFLRELQF